MSKGDFEHATDRIQHEAAWDVYAAENPEQLCHVVGCGEAWLKNTGTILVLNGSKRGARLGYATFLICAKHDDESSLRVERDGATISIP